MASAADIRMLRRLGIAMPRVRVVRDYRRQYANPIRFVAGDSVTLGEHDPEWPAFVWTITADGNAGWAPAAWLNPLGDGRAEATREYSAEEATASTGEEGRVSQSHGGWSWLVADHGASGWIPDSHLEVLAEAPLPEPEVESLATGLIRYWTARAQEDPEATEAYEWAATDWFYLEQKDPETLWALILHMLKDPECEPVIGMLAAGPLEDLLAQHGPAFIDRVEHQARHDPAFAHLLGGVWQFTMTDDIWARVQAVWNPNGWDGTPA